MFLEMPAIICTVKSHGEHGVIVRALTADHGLVSGYVGGGRSRTMRPVLMASNLVQARLHARSPEQMASLTVELVHSRGPLLREPIAAAALEWATALSAIALPERHPYPRLYAALDGLLSAIEAAPAARDWVAALVRFELLILSEIGFGLDLTVCAANGTTTDLAFVSPKSAAAISASAGSAYKHKLLRLPPFVLDGATGDWADLFDGLNLTGHFLERNILGDRRVDVLPARTRLIDRLKRAVA